ncbi:PQQ-dependent sugar dehydrogenase [Stenotrophomonas sp. HITSZ_GD]|uniref:PQQ-dependent sugar dehydrogenase n=1 Tax=Stenotrophomonas sp. HITSZ_GD TaxID=3037248 RepID=UPI00240DCA8B|nr:PQQ-dependent sugar dehydrogenase [Stenotrophomonas sp. HITSZ_GD]MDG2526284.1 PQQ-dependent sugar dehydrogenase [Stenotrophomonas sp. HITSZ_GD]
MTQAARTLLPLALALALLSACHRQDDAATGTPTARSAATAPPRPLPSQAGEIQVRELATGLAHPWGLALLPEGGFLVTERGGALRRIGADGSVSAPLAGVPAVYARGQGGLLDVALAPDFAQSRRIYLSYAEPGEGVLAGTAVARAVLGEAGLSEVQVIYRQAPKVDAENHFGARLAFDGQGHVFISQGERTMRMMSQQLDKLQGKLVRLNLDGSVPADNPFVGQQGARPEIWSYGHRNSQGLAFDPRSGKLWESEHGPRGGDEINLPEPGKNYGWPLITWGIDYSGQPIAESVGQTREGLEQPYHYWPKSPGVSGMAFYTGHAGSAWNDSLLLGSLAERNLIRLTLDGERITGEERLLGELEQRIRDVRVGADGNVYVLTDETQGQLLQITPPKG